jgi:hypothetical protein
MTTETKRPAGDISPQGARMPSLCGRRTSDRIQRQRGEPSTTENRDQSDDARISVTPVVIRIRQQHRATLLHRDIARDAEQPFLRHDASSSEPCRVHIQRVRRVRVRVRVREEPYPRDVVGGRGGIEQRSLQRALRYRLGCLCQRREQEREGMRADPEGAADEQDGDQSCANSLEFCEAVGVSRTGRPTR